MLTETTTEERLVLAPRNSKGTHWTQFDRHSSMEAPRQQRRCQVTSGGTNTVVRLMGRL